MVESYRLGEVLGFDTEEQAMSIAKKAALEVRYEELYSVRVERRGETYLPLLLLRRTSAPLTQRELQAEVIVDRGSGEPCGLFLHGLVESNEQVGPYIEAWEEDFHGIKRGPVQMMFLPFRKDEAAG